MTEKRCKAKKLVGGTMYRCEGQADHQSVHFNDRIGWWPNETSFWRLHWLEVVSWIAVGAFCVGLLYYVIWVAK